MGFYSIANLVVLHGWSNDFNGRSNYFLLGHLATQYENFISSFAIPSLRYLLKLQWLPNRNFILFFDWLSKLIVVPMTCFVIIYNAYRKITITVNKFSCNKCCCSKFQIACSIVLTIVIELYTWLWNTENWSTVLGHQVNTCILQCWLIDHLHSWPRNTVLQILLKIGML